MKLFVSVIIPVNNRAETIKKAVESVLVQTHHLLEVLIVDDCSVDDTPSIVEEICRNDHRVRLNRLDKNVGGGAARNEGIVKARGDIVAFLDSDDYWYPQKLERQLQLLCEADDPFNTVVYAQASILTEVNTESMVQPFKAISQDQSILDYLFCHKGFMQTSGLLMSRRLASNVLFRKLPRHQDYDFCLRLQESGAKFVMVNEPLYCWDNRHFSDRISRMFDVDQSLDWAMGVYWPEKIVFEGYLKTHRIFPRLVYKRGVLKTAYAAVVLMFKGLISTPFAINQVGTISKLVWKNNDRVARKKLLLDKVRRSGKGMVIIYGAGQYFCEILPELLDLGITIDCVVDKVAENKRFYVKDYMVVTIEEAIKRSKCSRIIIASSSFSSDIHANILRKWPSERGKPEIICI